MCRKNSSRPLISFPLSRRVNSGLKPNFLPFILAIADNNCITNEHLIILVSKSKI